MRPISPPNLFHNFSCVSPVVAWHTLFDELTISPETVGAHGVRPIQWSNLIHHFSWVGALRYR
ncbi:MAG: hypothetical protein RIE73_17680 [Coleofasciculus sp. C1-SOL-03]|uniref:hypothetical protein n=1 Tax=Coleofasciculus sp. C1-SOL-03 TaxID=3069522 RepID=UPI0032F0C250